MHSLGQTRNHRNHAAVISLIVALLVNPFAAVTVKAGPVVSPALEQTQEKPATPGPSSHGSIDTANPQLEKATKVDKNVDQSAAARTALDTYIVVLEGAPLASYRGGVAGLAPTNPAVQGRKKVDMRSPASQAYLGYLEQQQADFIGRANKTLGRPLEILYSYKATVNGFAAKMTESEARRLAKLPGVRFVEKDKLYQLHTDTGPAWLGAPEIWGGTLSSLPFGASLSGANEVPPVTTTASGAGTFTYNLHTRELTYTIEVANITNIVLAHIHRGAAGVNGPVAYMLYDGTGVFDPGHPISGKVTLSEADQVLLMNQGLYANVHTTANPTGEIRGQLISKGTLGEGVVVGVIDTGIDPWNPSFAVAGSDGYTHTNPLGEGHYLGVCDPSNTAPPSGVVAYDPTFPCNSKLIGVWGYKAVAPSPRDTEGHGSHTASTAAGNIVANPVVNTPTGSFTVDMISGVAPHANIIAYGACCAGSSLQAARDQALIDGVDVINYSIGSTSPTPDPYNEVEALSWLAIRDAGIFVAVSAGNSGPGDETIGSPADLPWVTTAGASSHNRAFVSTVTLSDGTHAPLELAGMALTTGFGPAPIVMAKDFVIAPTTPDDARFCAPGAFPPGTFSGQIVVCERGGGYARVDKGQSVKDGGAGGLILAQPTAFGGGPGSITADTHVLPATHIDFPTYQQLLNYVAAATGPVNGVISGGAKVVDDAYGNIMGEFSSRGPNGGLFNEIIEPSVTAPGRSILAAYNQGATDGEYTYNVIQGTSMASPHVAGAGALMVALHPDWTPAEIQSAIMSTARTNVLNDDGVNPATPFAQGSGHVDLTRAAHAGLVLDATKTEYLAANPATGGDPKNINLASVSNTSCLITCSWTRTVKSTLDTPETWTVSGTTSNGVNITANPAQFTIQPGATQAIVITADATAAARNAWLFGEVQLTAAGNTPAAHFPLAIVSTPSIFPASVDVHTRRDAGSQLVSGLRAIDISNLTVTTYGLVGGTKVELSLNEDPTHADPYDNVNDGTVSVTLVDVPANALRLAANIIASAAPDVDLYVGTGSVPSEATQVCVSATGTALESCLVDHPAAGTWWILVQNWEASSSPPDAITLTHAVVLGDNGNLTIEKPTSVAGGTPFDVRVFWNEPAMQAGETWYGAFSLGTDAANPGNLGTIFVNVIRENDDVTKSVDPATAKPGDTVTYQIVVETNVTPENLAYTIQDTIPAGLTYVPGSATASAGTVSVSGNALTWTGVVTAANKVEGQYIFTSNQTDQACGLPIGDGGYYDALTRIGFTPDPTLFGDSINWGYNSFGGTDFYGTAHAAPPQLTDDGIAVFGQYAGKPWLNQNIPDPAAPNGLLAPYWRDMEVVYDAAANKGVTAVTFGSGILWLVEFDDIQAFGEPNNHLDYEVLSWHNIDPSAGSYDAYYAFDNVNITDTIGTIGVENDAGDKATQFAYNNFTPTNGLVLCLDYVGAAPVVITYDATVNADAPKGVLTNQVVHNTDNPGSQPVTTSADLTIERDDVLFVSLGSSAKLPGLSARDEDILAYNMQTHTWSKFFDGSDVGVGDNDVNAFYLADNGDIYVSFNKSQNMHGKVNYHGPDQIKDTNIYRFVPDSLGENTAGHFELYFDGSDVGLSSDGEDIDALYIEPSGALIISTLGSYKVPGPGGTTLRGKDEDLLVFTPTSLGENTAGTWSLFLDGSAQGLNEPSEDISGVWLNSQSQIFLTAKGNFSVAGAQGDGADIFVCTLGGSGCTFSLALDGSTIGLDGERIDGLAFGSLPDNVSAAVVDNSDQSAEPNDEADDDVPDSDDDAQNTNPIYLPFVQK